MTKFIKIQIFIAIIIFSVFGITKDSLAIPAFPGAEGFGSQSIGGRGGTVIKVTNLNDNGPGSFRWALQENYPRIIVFNVSGIINLVSIIRGIKPYVTIAGETSPGGILIAGSYPEFNTHDVIIRHMRFRAGTNRVNYARDANGDIIYYNKINAFSRSDQTCTGTIVSPTLTDGTSYPCPFNTGMDPNEIHSIQVLGAGYGWEKNMAYNIIIDHCSFSWGVDENANFGAGTLTTTIQWSIFSEGLSKAGHSSGEHSKGVMISGKPHTYNNEVSFHHNYIAHNTDRSPMLFSPGDQPLITTVDGVNNISYDWKGSLSPWAEESIHLNWVHNYAKRGISSNASSFELAYTSKPLVGATPVALLYVLGNIGSTRLLQTQPDWNVGTYYTSTLLPETWRKSVPWATPYPITTTEMSYAYALEILEDVGATKPVRDSVDTRVVADFNSGTGNRILNVEYPDDYPVFATPNPPADADSDGMADTWEISRGLNTAINDSTGDDDSDGYTNIEEYLHFLAGYVDTTFDNTPPTGSININNGSDTTNSAGVNLSLSAADTSGVTEMKISNINNINSVTAESFIAVKSWILTAGDGLKTVYAWFKDTIGNWMSSPATDTITLSTPIPTCTTFTYSEWDACQPNNIQTRTVISSLPSGCIDGNPVTTNSCIYSSGSGGGGGSSGGSGISYDTPIISTSSNADYATSTVQSTVTSTTTTNIIKTTFTDNNSSSQNNLIIQNNFNIIDLSGQSSEMVNNITNKESTTVSNQKQRIKLNTASIDLYLKTTNNQSNLSNENKYAIAYFIHYGTPTTQRLGAGERAGVINSYKSAYYRIPKSVEEWQDVIKIANGRWTKERSETKENKIKTEIFKKVYQRDPDPKNPNDNNTIQIMTYGLRPISRNTNSEKNSINTFRYIFSYAPTTASDWDIVRAIAYGGARR